MKFLPTDRFGISDEVLSQEVNGETVLLDLDGESYFSLNEVGTRIWQLIKIEYTVGEVLNTLSDEYDVKREQLESDVGEWLDRLGDAGLVKNLGQTADRRTDSLGLDLEEDRLPKNSTSWP